MIRIEEVKTKKQQKIFVDFPTNLYKDNKYYVPMLRGDELGIFSPKKNVCYDECETIFFLCYDDKKVVGRVAGIIQKVYNLKTGTKKARFSRFDCIDNQEVASSLLSAVENWAKSKGMDTVHGPLGFHDLEREGLLIEGFDRLATFEQNYNFPYYQKLIENHCYEKDADYVSFRIKLPTTTNDRVKRLCDLILKRYDLHIVKEKTKRAYINKYKNKIFDLIDEAYGDLYGVIPYNEKLRKQIIDQFNLIIKLPYLVSIADKDDNLVAFGFALPSMAEAVQKCKGRLFPTGAFRILHQTNHCNVADFGLVAVKKEFQGKGVTAIILDYIITMAKEVGVDTIETNHSLETNHKILQTWKNFDDVEQHKRLRCFTKSLIEKPKKTTKSKPKNKGLSSTKKSTTKTSTKNKSTKKSTTQKNKSKTKNTKNS